MSRHDDTDSESDSGAVAGHPLPASPRARRGNMTSDSDSDSKEGEGPAVRPADDDADAVGAAKPAAAAGADSPDGAKEKEREIFVWRIPLNQWRLGTKDREYSPDFELDGETWRLLCFPKGNPNHSVAGCMAAYLELRDPRAFYSMVCHFKMQMVHPTDTSKCAWREADHTFTNTETDRGFNDLLTPATLAEYTHADGCVVLNVSAWKAPPGFQMAKYGDYVPYDSKASTGFCGIMNQGATCYMNSMLQALYLLPKFREVVYQIPSDADDRGAKIGFALQRVFYALQTGSRGVSTKQLTSSFGWGSIENFVQHDVQEFCRVLLDSLDTTTKKTALAGVIASLFEGKSQAYIACMNVDYKSQRDETFWDLSINVKGCKTLTDSFAQYVEEEILDGDNKYRAEGHGLQAAKKGTRFIAFPPVLQLQLKRFEYDPMRDTMVKINDRFEFPAEVDLTRFLDGPRDESGNATGEPVIYSLHSVLVHSGGVHGGHYYSYIRPFMASVPYDSAPWYKFDDETVTKATFDDAVTGNYGGADTNANKFKGGYWGMGGRVSTTSAYMLIYVRKAAIQTLVAVGAGMMEPPPAEAAEEEAKLTDDKEKEKAKVAAVVDEQKEGAVKDKEGKEGKEKEKEKDKKVDLPRQFPVPIPESLTARFKSEEAAEKERAEARKRAAQFMDLHVLCESKLLSTPVGPDFAAEVYDVATGFLTYSTDPMDSSIKVQKKATLAEIAPALAEKYGIPVERQEYWILNNRTSNEAPRPHQRIEAHGLHAGRGIEELVRDLSSTIHISPIYLRDTASDPRPVPLETPKVEPLAPGANPAAPLPAALAPGALNSKNSLLILYKFFDVPTQKMLFLGSAHFARDEPVQSVRDYAATLLQRHVASQKDKAAAAGAEEKAVDELSGALSQLSVEASAAGASQLTSADLFTAFEVKNGEAKSFAFNPAPPPPSDPELLKNYREPQDWNVITLGGLQVGNGEMCIFNIRYTKEELARFRESYERKYEIFCREHQGGAAATVSKVEAAAAANQPAAAATPAGAVAEAAAAAAAATFAQPFKSKFSNNAVLALDYYANRIVLEFRALPYTAPKPHAMSTTMESAAAVVAPTVYQAKPGVLTMEVMRTEAYVSMLDKLGSAVHTDPQRLRLFRPSLLNDDVADSHYIQNSYAVKLDTCAVADVLPRMRDHPAVFYYSVMEYTWRELEHNVPVNMTYSDKNLVLYSFQCLVPKLAKFHELGPIALARVEELKKKDDPSYESPAQLVVPPMHYFAIDFRQTVRELSLDGRVGELKDYLVNGSFSVNIMEDTEEELKLRQHTVPGERIIWVRRYYPLGGVYWRPAGVPFTFVCKDGESVRDFRARLQDRLSYDDSQMAQVEMAVLTQQEHKPVTKDDDQPWELIADDLRGVWTCLGVYNPVLRKGAAAAAASGNASFKSSYNGAVKFNP